MYSQSLFAVWHWPRWVWCAIVPLMLAVYFVSAAPVDWLILYCGVHYPNDHWEFLDRVLSNFYLPVEWVIFNTDLGAEIYSWQWDLMDQCFGRIETF